MRFENRQPEVTSYDMFVYYGRMMVFRDMFVCVCFHHFARAGCFQPRSLNDYLTNQPTNQPTNHMFIIIICAGYRYPCASIGGEGEQMCDLPSAFQTNGPNRRTAEDKTEKMRPLKPNPLPNPLVYRRKYVHRVPKTPRLIFARGVSRGFRINK